MSPDPTRTSTLQNQINILTNRVEKGFSELKDMLQGFDTRVREMEKQEASCKPLLDNQISAAWRKIDEHSTEIKVLDLAVTELKLIIVELKRTQTMLSWLGGLLGSTVVIWIVSQILGTIH